MRCELVSIGTELLLGAITDTNATYIAQQLQSIGLDLIYKTTVGDNEQRIAAVIDAALDRVDIVITTGGLGPTVDDVTREAIARATGRPLELRQEMLDQIAERFRRFGVRMSENNRRQAMMPQGALAIENPVGTAPIFILETERGVIMTLPGVPREMKHLMEHALLPWLKDYLGAPAVITSRILRTAGIGESQVDARIADLMTAANPTVGLAAHAGQTDIRITAKASSQAAAEALMAPVEEEIRRRLGTWIYGSGDRSIESTLLEFLTERGASLAFVEAGTGELLRERLLSAASDQQSKLLYPVDVVDIPGHAEDEREGTAHRLAAHVRTEQGATYGLSILIYGEGGLPGGGPGTSMSVVSSSGSRSRQFGWGRDRTDSPIWATTHAMALLLRLIQGAEEPQP